MILILVLAKHSDAVIKQLKDATCGITCGVGEVDIPLQQNNTINNFCLGLAEANLREMEFGLFTHVVVLGNAKLSKEFISVLLAKPEIITTVSEGKLLNAWSSQVSLTETNKFCMNFVSTFSTAYALMSMRKIKSLGESADLRGLLMTDDDVKFGLTASKLNLVGVGL